MRFGLDVAGRPQVGERRPGPRLADRLGLIDFAESYPTTLSGGMRQRVAIARALAVEPEILLMDEPFAALDAQLRLVLQEEFLGLWEADRRTVVFVTHSLEEAILLGDRVLVMSARPGKIIADSGSRSRVPATRMCAAPPSSPACSSRSGNCCGSKSRARCALPTRAFPRGASHDADHPAGARRVFERRLPGAEQVPGSGHAARS